MASFWAGSIARGIVGSKHAYGGLLVTAASTLAATSPLSSNNDHKSHTSCEHEEFRRRHDQLKSAKAKKFNLKTRMTSVGHFSLASQTPNNPSVASFFMTMVGDKPGFTTKDFQELWEERGIPERHPRFHYAISETNQGYFEPEKSNTEHVKETFFPFLYRKDIQSRIEALQTEPLNVHDKTWEVQIASTGPVGTSGGASKFANSEEHDQQDDLVESVMFFRGHHALGDGVSLFTAIMDLCDEAEEFRELIKVELKKRFGRRKGVSILDRFVRQLKKFILFWIGCFEATWHQGKLHLGAMLESNALKQLHKWALQDELIDETDIPKRSISFGMAAPVDEVKWVAQTLIGRKATVNDVFVSCVSAAIARQLAVHRQRLEVLDDVAAESKDDKIRKRHATRRELALMEKMNIVMPVHLYGGVMLPGQSLGNRIGAMVARVPGELEEGQGCVDRLASIHETLYALKQTPTPLLSYMVVRLTSAISGTLLPNSWTQFLFSKANANAVAVVSNVRGPPKPLHIKGRLISSIHGFVPLPPGIPIGVVVSSYAGNVKLSLSAEPWAVPDGDQFLIYVLEEYQSLLRRAKLKAISP